MNERRRSDAAGVGLAELIEPGAELLVEDRDLAIERAESLATATASAGNRRA
jgi:hypothetical protein